jgi:prolyl-tRNA synthetase
MVIRPYGYALWENMQRLLDARIKATGHQNAYFPLLIPESLLQLEADHVEGFRAPGGVGDARRQRQARGATRDPPDQRGDHRADVLALDRVLSRPAGAHQPVGERHALGEGYAAVPAHRRVPVAGGHTAHATPRSARPRSRSMLEVYREFVETELAIRCTRAARATAEKFAGAEMTYSIEALMRDGKALQAGTSHNLGSTSRRSSTSPSRTSRAPPARVARPRGALRRA